MFRQPAPASLSPHWNSGIGSSYVLYTRHPYHNQLLYSIVIPDEIMEGDLLVNRSSADAASRHIACAHNTLMKLAQRQVLPVDTLTHIFSFVVDVHPCTAHETAWLRGAMLCGAAHLGIHSYIHDERKCTALVESAPAALRTSRVAAAVILDRVGHAMEDARRSEHQTNHQPRSREKLAWVLKALPDQMVANMDFWKSTVVPIMRRRSDWSVHDILAALPATLRTSPPFLQMLIDAGCNTPRSIVEARDRLLYSDELCPPAMLCTDADFVMYFNRKFMKVAHCCLPVWTRPMGNSQELVFARHRGSNMCLIPIKVKNQFRSLFDNKTFRKHLILDHLVSLLSLMSFSSETSVIIAGQPPAEPIDAFFPDSEFVKSKVRISDYQEMIDSLLHQDGHLGQSAHCARRDVHTCSVPFIVRALPDAILREFSTTTWSRIIHKYPFLSRQIPADAVADMVQLIIRHFPCTASTRSVTSRHRHPQTKRKRGQTEVQMSTQMNTRRRLLE